MCNDETCIFCVSVQFVVDVNACARLSSNFIHIQHLHWMNKVMQYSLNKICEYISNLKTLTSMRRVSFMYIFIATLIWHLSEHSMCLQNGKPAEPAVLVFSLRQQIGRAKFRYGISYCTNSIPFCINMHEPRQIHIFHSFRHRNGRESRRDTTVSSYLHITQKC